MIFGFFCFLCDNFSRLELDDFSFGEMVDDPRECEMLAPDPGWKWDWAMDGFFSVSMFERWRVSTLMFEYFLTLALEDVNREFFEFCA